MYIILFLMLLAICFLLLGILLELLDIKKMLNRYVK